MEQIKKIEPDAITFGKVFRFPIFSNKFIATRYRISLNRDEHKVQAS